MHFIQTHLVLDINTGVEDLSAEKRLDKMFCTFRWLLESERKVAGMHVELKPDTYFSS